MGKPGYLRAALVARGLLPATGGFLAPAPLAVARAAAVHALAYVERVANQTPRRPPRRAPIGLPNTAAVARRAFLSAAGTLLAARLALEHGLALQPRRRRAPRRPRRRRRLLRLQRRRDRRPGAPRRRPRRAASSSSTATSTRATAPPASSPAAPTSSRSRCTPSATTPRARPPRTSTSRCPTASPTAPTSRSSPTRSPPPSAFRPDLVFYNAGVDPHADDRLGRLALTDAGLRARDALRARLGARAAACRSPASSAAATTTTRTASPPATPSSSRKPRAHGSRRPDAGPAQAEPALGFSTAVACARGRAAYIQRIYTEIIKPFQREKYRRTVRRAGTRTFSRVSTARIGRSPHDLHRRVAVPISAA